MESCWVRSEDGAKQVRAVLRIRFLAAKAYRVTGFSWVAWRHHGQHVQPDVRRSR
jgi:hypothetical protein